MGTASVDDSLTILRQRADRLSEELQNLNAPIPDPPTDESISCDIEQVIQKYSTNHDIADEIEESDLDLISRVLTEDQISAIRDKRASLVAKAVEPPSTSTEDKDKQKSIDKDKGHRKNRALVVDLETLEEALQMMADFKPT